MDMPHSSINYTPLRRALSANAVFSLLTGSVMVISSSTVASLLGHGVEPLIFVVIGAGLLPFGAFVAWLASRSTPEPLLALAVSIGDLIWVAGSVVLLAVASEFLKPAGLVATVVVAMFVLGFAIGQLKGIARLYSQGSGGRFRVCFDINSNGNANMIWGNLADLGAISRFAPTLVSSSLRSDSGPTAGCIRDCVDTAGRSWSERCKLIDHEQRTLVMEFLANDPGFPFPFVEMSGGWSVHDGAHGARVRVWWEGMPKFPRLNSLLLPLLAWQARCQFPAVVAALSGESKLSDQVRLHPVIAPC